MRTDWTPPRWLPRTVAAVALAVSAADVVFFVLLSDRTKTAAVVLLAVFPVVGLLITRVQPRSVVGWTFLGQGVLQSLTYLGDGGAGFGLRHGWPEAVNRPLADLNLLWLPAIFLPLAVGLAHFPDGRLPGRVWAFFDRLALGLMIWWTVLLAIAVFGLPARQLSAQSDPHPDGWRGVLFLAGAAAFPLMLPCVVAAVVGLILRWRRSAAVQRLQIRWVAIAGLVALVAELTQNFVGGGDTAQTVVEGLGQGLIAVATGFAITRYHLYDIDRILSRTVAYALITVLLGATYLGLAALGAAVIPSRYGSLGTAGATLAVAALFVPVRRRLRDRIDRRFNRARYDAARTIDAFASSLRADLDERQLTGQLLATVQRVVEPAHVSVWTVPR